MFAISLCIATAATFTFLIWSMLEMRKARIAMQGSSREEWSFILYAIALLYLVIHIPWFFWHSLVLTVVGAILAFCFLVMFIELPAALVEEFTPDGGSDW